MEDDPKDWGRANVISSLGGGEEMGQDNLGIHRLLSLTKILGKAQKQTIKQFVSI